MNKERFVPYPMDWGGTISKLAGEGGAESLKRYLEEIKIIEERENVKVKPVLITGSPRHTLEKRLKLLNALAESNGQPDLFEYAIGEFCGLLVSKDGEELIINPMPQEIEEKQEELAELIQNIGLGYIYPDIITYGEVLFPNGTEKQKILEVEEKIKAANLYSDKIEIRHWDEGIDIKASENNKGEAVKYVLESIYPTEEYEIPFVLISGDEPEDLKMVTAAKAKGMPVHCIFPKTNHITNEDIQGMDVYMGENEDIIGINEALRDFNESR